MGKQWFLRRVWNGLLAAALAGTLMGSVVAVAHYYSEAPPVVNVDMR